MIDLTDEELDDLLWNLNEDSSKLLEYIVLEEIPFNIEKENNEQDF